MGSITRFDTRLYAYSTRVDRYKVLLVTKESGGSPLKRI